MPKIIELPVHVADLIAAGEVVERPASVIKELMENSLDAGAGIITVEITSGGLTHMRVTDDGGGIASSDAETAFLRHATSKLKNANGLESIATLGFRGEALCAIAAVSEIEMLTRETGTQQGISLRLKAGNVTETSPAGCPEGTTIIVRDLFFNTPARLKFMKSDRAEGAAATAIAQRIAMSQPGVGVRFIRNGKTEFHTPGDYRIDSCVYSLLGGEFLQGLTPVHSEVGSVSAEGFVSNPNMARGNRNFQFFFVNGRYIRSKLLSAALEQAFSNTLPGGKYPACVLYITANPGSLDVNVHPAKTEIKFAAEKDVFDCVRFAGLCGIGSPPKSAPTDQMTIVPSSWQPTQDPVHIPNTTNYDSRHGFKTSIPPDIERGSYSPLRDESVQPYHTNANAIVPPSSVSKMFRVIGEALDTYIIAEYGGSLWIIDKHAAHERIHFDALKNGSFAPMSQALISPIICRFGHENAAILCDNAAMLDGLGFTVESLGDDSIAVRRIPSEIEISDAESALSEICAVLSYKTPEPDLDTIYRTIACKAAIKAGKSSEKREHEALCEKVFSGEISHCPHGRPVLFELSKSTLDRNFKRI